ncbi:MAG: hypothetical protein KDD42_03040, partial [Bdellovibrionales bacterium]|nr:hypothetical protein [Bdellovibrionales bacterium]
MSALQSKTKRYKVFIVVCFLFVCLYSLIFFFSPDEIGRIDLAQYWTSAYLVRHGENPYDENRVRVLQSALFNFSSPVRMWNPPWILSPLLPLSLLPLELLAPLWLIIGVTLTFSSLLIAVVSAREFLSCEQVERPIWKEKLGLNVVDLCWLAS